MDPLHLVELGGRQEGAPDGRALAVSPVPKGTATWWSRIIRRLIPRVGLVSLVVLAAAAPAGAATSTASDTQSSFRELARGAIVVVSPNCPFGDFAPEQDTQCDTYVVWYVQNAGSTLGHPDIEESAFHAEVDHFVDVVHPDGTFVNVLTEFGVAAASGTYDEQHLTSARMDAVEIPMMTIDGDTGDPVPNGTTTSLGTFTWTAASPIYVWGNDGPALGGGPRHIQTPCGPIGTLAHQKDTVGYVTGTINGASIDNFFQQIQIPGIEPTDGTGYIFDNAFKFHFVDHCTT
jgi:hypothetical protein